MRRHPLLLLLLSSLGVGACDSAPRPRRSADAAATVDGGRIDPAAPDGSAPPGDLAPQQPPPPPPVAGRFTATTDSFLSTLKLMHGSQGGLSPDTYLAPGGILCVVAAGATDHCTPFGYATAADPRTLVDRPALTNDPTLGEPVAASSLFRLGSTSKMFVGLATAICKHRALVASYDDPVATYVAELAGTAVGKTTLEQLFTHTGGLPLLHRAGLRETDPEVISADMNQIIGGLESMAINPGKVGSYSYSDVGVVLLTEVIARVQPLPYEAFVRQEILAPLGMSQTYFHTREIDRSLKTTGYESSFSPVVDPDLQGYAPVGGMYSTGPDMARLMGLYQQALDPKGPRPLAIDPAIIQDLTAIHFDAPPNSMGISIDVAQQAGRTHVGHNGRIDGYASFFSFAEEAALGLVFFANGGFPLGRTAAPQLLSTLLR